MECLHCQSGICYLLIMGIFEMNLSFLDKPIRYTHMENMSSTQFDRSDSEKNETQEYKRICKRGKLQKVFL